MEIRTAKNKIVKIEINKNNFAFRKTCLLKIEL